MPELLWEGCNSPRHDRPGLRIVRNDHNGFVVASLYYWADPSKRAEVWEREAKAGMSEAQWRKEYLIDYSALFGEKVFPEFSARRSEIVVPGDQFDPAEVGKCWAGFDFGLRNPSALIIFAYRDGVWYAVWELYEPCRNVVEFASKVKACPYWSNVKFVAADPSIRHHRSYRSDGSSQSIMHYFADNGIRNMVPGKTDEAPFVAKLREFWGQDEPGFRIADTCPNLISELDGIVYSGPSQSDAELANRAYSDAMIDVRNHAIDATKYFFSMLPNPRAMGRDWHNPEMARWWRH